MSRGQWIFLAVVGVFFLSWWVHVRRLEAAAAGHLAAVGNANEMTGFAGKIIGLIL